MFTSSSVSVTPILWSLLKATVKKQVWINGYTKGDGTFVPGHHTMVHVSDDHDPVKVATGQGSFSQKQAHAKLSKESWFLHLSQEHQAAVVMKHATELQDAASASAAVSGYKASILAGKKPTASQVAAFHALPDAKRTALAHQLMQASPAAIDLIAASGGLSAAAAHDAHMGASWEANEAKGDAPSSAHLLAGLKEAVLAGAMPAPSQLQALADMPKADREALIAELASKQPKALQLLHSATLTAQAPEQPQPAPAPAPLADPEPSHTAGNVALSGWKKAVLSGKKPTPAQMHAFAALSPKDQEALEGETSEAGAVDSHLAAMALASVNHAEGTAKAKAEAKANAEATAGLESIDSWKKVGEQKGSNPGGMYMAPDGTKWYCKTPQSADHAKNEVLAGKLYEAADVEVPDMKLVTIGGKVGVASRIVDGLSKGAPSTLAQSLGTHDGFAVDAWLGNWDVVGLAHDNLLLKEGQAFRVDTGGALLYRAQGSAKGDKFGNTVTELQSLRHAGTNSQAAGVFGSISNADLAASIGKVEALTPTEIQALVSKYGPGDEAAKQALTIKLIKRREYLLGYKASLPGVNAAPAPAAAPAAAPAPAPAPVAPAGPKEGDTKPGANGSTLVLKNGRWVLQLDEQLVDGYKAAIVAGQAPTKEQALHVEALGDADELAEHMGEMHMELAGQVFAALDDNEDEALAHAHKVHAAMHAHGLAGTQPAKLKPAPPPGKPPAVTPDDKLPLHGALMSAMLPSTNTNAGPVNKKLGAIHAALMAGDLAALQAMKFGSNTYGVKCAKLAQQAIALLSGGASAAPAGPVKVVSAAEVIAPPTFVPKTATAKPKAKVEKPKPDPTKLQVKPDAIPPAPNFTTMNGGKGLSSAAHVNAANTKDSQALYDYALKGNLTGLESYHYDAISKETGAALGKKPIEQHPSNQVKSYWSELVASLQMIANPPESLREFTAVLGENIKALSAAFKNEKYGVTTAKAAANKKLAYFIALGKVATPAALVASPMYAPLKFESTPAKKVTVTAQQNAKAQADYKSLKQGSLVKKFINGIQSSGSYNNNFRDGKVTGVGGEDFEQMNLEAHEYAQEKPAGFEIYKWISLGKDMQQALLNAPAGTVFQNPGSMCTSTAPTATSGFGAHRLRIRYAPGAKGVDSYGSGNYSGEKEITTLPGSRFVILSAAMVQCPVKGGPRLELDLLMLPPDETYVADLKARAALKKKGK